MESKKYVLLDESTGSRMYINQDQKDLLDSLATIEVWEKGKYYIINDIKFLLEETWEFTFIDLGKK